MPKCEGCGAVIEFTEGNRMPIQRVRSVYRQAPGSDGIYLDRLSPKPAPGETKVLLWINHFEVCPEANRFSGRNRGKR